MEIKRKGLWSVIALLLAGFTVWTVIRGSGMSLKEFAASLHEASKGWIVLAFISMLCFIIFEGEALLTIVGSCGYGRGPGVSGFARWHGKGFLYSAADVYFSAITPSATGGQPASAFFMMRDGIPGALTTAALLVNLICYNAAIVTLGILGIILRPKVFLGFGVLSKVLIGGGALIILGLTLLFYMLLHKREFLFRGAVKVTGFLHRIHLLKNPEKLQTKLLHTMEEYKKCVDMMSGHTKMWVKAYLLNVAQRASQILVTGAAYRALGGIGSTIRLLVTQCFVVIGSNCVPIPGAMGVADYLMLDGYTTLMEHDFAFHVQMLSRSISFYCCIIVSGLTVVLALLIHRGEHS